MPLIRRTASVALAMSLAVGPVFGGTPLALLRASVTSASGSPLSGHELRLVNLDTGRRVSGVTDASGVFATQLPPGLYSVDTIGTGDTLVRGPRVVSLAAGQVLMASLAIAEAAQTAPSTLSLNHDPIGCLIAGEFPLIDAAVQPMGQFSKGRVHFKSTQSPDFYYVEVVPGVGGITARLPRPRLEASPVTYYIEVTDRDFHEVRTAEIRARVVRKAGECDRKVAAIAPGGPATVFTASGAVAAGAAGFGAAGAAAAGGLLGLSTTTALIVGGVVVAGGVAVIVATTGGEPASPSR